eukprot:460722-Hanusia_phi.AAC.3
MASGAVVGYVRSTARPTELGLALPVRVRDFGDPGLLSAGARPRANLERVWGHPWFGLTADQWAAARVLHDRDDCCVVGGEGFLAFMFQRGCPVPLADRILRGQYGFPLSDRGVVLADNPLQGGVIMGRYLGELAPALGMMVRMFNFSNMLLYSYGMRMDDLCAELHGHPWFGLTQFQWRNLVMMTPPQNWDECVLRGPSAPNPPRGDPGVILFAFKPRFLTLEQLPTKLFEITGAPINAQFILVADPAFTDGVIMGRYAMMPIRRGRI